MTKLTILFGIAVLVFYAKADDRDYENNIYTNFGKIPDIKMPEITMPDIRMPDIRMPQIKMPDFKMPKIKIPDIKMPEIKMPEMPKPLTEEDIKNMKPVGDGMVSGISQSSYTTYEMVNGERVPVIKRRTIINTNGKITEYDDK